MGTHYSVRSPPIFNHLHKTFCLEPHILLVEIWCVGLLVSTSWKNSFAIWYCSWKCSLLHFLQNIIPFREYWKPINPWGLEGIHSSIRGELCSMRWKINQLQVLNKVWRFIIALEILSSLIFHWQIYTLKFSPITYCSDHNHLTAANSCQSSILSGLVWGSYTPVMTHLDSSWRY